MPAEPSSSLHLRAAVATFAFGFAFALGGCDSGRVSREPVQRDPVSPPATSQVSQPLGEVVDGFPHDQERMVAVLTNLARHSTTTPNGNECGDWTEERGAIVPLKPLVYTLSGNRAARFTSDHLQELGCFQHESCCVLDKVGGEVKCVAQAAGGCGGEMCLKECSGGTSTGGRYDLLGFGAFSGENIAMGQASAYEAWCAWMKSSGHRANIYGSHTQLGVGHFQESAAVCGRRYWTQAFGRGAVPLPRIPAASAMHPTITPSDATRLSFAANYYDPSGGAPKRSVVVVGTRCIELTKNWGEIANGTYEASFTDPNALPKGCVPYYFLFVDANGNRATYPDTGSLRVAIGNGSSCPSGFIAEQARGECEGGEAECSEGETRNCYTGASITLNVGLCREGQQFCNNGFWSGCVGEVLPIEETCDGRDNDCDGAIDQGNPGGGASCEALGEIGPCVAGVRQCIGGTLSCLSVVTPEAELCDGIDNDCDGEVDDGFGTVVCGVGECFRRIESCEGGVPQTCTPGVPEEDLPDGRDNDCDGYIDNGTDCRREDGGFGFTRSCSTFPRFLPDGGATGFTLPCRAGGQTCQVDGGWSLCNGEIGPSQEICDGIDNDCDGRRDDPKDLGQERCGQGECLAVGPTCKAGVLATCTPKLASMELCNGRDDDCDGDFDEGCVCRTGTANSCYSGPILTLNVGTCRAGLSRCLATGFGPCEDEVVPRLELCDGLDDDCDGEIDDDCTIPDAGSGNGSGNGSGGGGGEPVVEPDPEPAPSGGCGAAPGSLALQGLVAIWLVGVRALRRRSSARGGAR